MYASMNFANHSLIDARSVLSLMTATLVGCSGSDGLQDSSMILLNLRHDIAIFYAKLYFVHNFLLLALET
jgi:hypothetical protein